MKFLIKRHIAIGDVFLITVCIKALKKRYPDCTIDVSTQIPEILRFNPHINKIYVYPSNGTNDYDSVFDLVNSYEFNPCTQIATCYLNQCGIFDEEDTIGDLWFNKKLDEFGRNFVSENYIVFEGSRTFHPGLNSRYYKKMNEVHSIIKSNGFKTMVIGYNNGIGIENADLDLTDKLSLMQTISLVAHHGISYVGYHGGMSHFLQGVPVPEIVYFTVHSAEYTQTLTEYLKVVNVKTDCFNCRTRLGNNHPSPWPSCYRPDIDCTETISVDEMVESILSHTRKYKEQIFERKLQINEIC